MHSIVAFVGMLAVASASVIAPSSRIFETPISRTSIVGPSGSITKEESFPIVAHDVPVVESRTIVEPTLVEAPLVVESRRAIVESSPVVAVDSPLVVESRRLISDPITVESRGLIHDPLTVETRRFINDPYTVIDPTYHRTLIGSPLVRSSVHDSLYRTADLTPRSFDTFSSVVPRSLTSRYVY